VASGRQVGPQQESQGPFAPKPSSATNREVEDLQRSERRLLLEAHVEAQLQQAGAEEDVPQALLVELRWLVGAVEQARLARPREEIDRVMVVERVQDLRRGGGGSRGKGVPVSVHMHRNSSSAWGVGWWRADGSRLLRRVARPC
jgi:hypothetical protein